MASVPIHVYGGEMMCLRACRTFPCTASSACSQVYRGSLSRCAIDRDSILVVIYSAANRVLCTPGTWPVSCTIRPDPRAEALSVVAFCISLEQCPTRDTWWGALHKSRRLLPLCVPATLDGSFINLFRRFRCPKGWVGRGGGLKKRRVYKYEPTPALERED